MKLISVNVEQDKHLATVRSFVERERADVVALMEVYEHDLATLLSQYPYRHFAPNFHIDGDQLGVAVGSKQPLTDRVIFYADGHDTQEIPPHGMGTHRPVMVSATTHGMEFAAVHFTWTPNMTETERQHTDLDRLLGLLAGREMILCGDFNIPRGNSAYVKLADTYRDNMPHDIETTIDPLLHRANRVQRDTLQVVVDYVWSTPQYRVTDVRVVDGVSDHCGVVATIDIV